MKKTLSKAFAILFFLGSVFVSDNAQAAETRYVHWTGVWEGKSPVYSTISSAITAAVSGDSIIISGGSSGHTYSENISTGTKQLDISGSVELGNDGRVLLSTTKGSTGFSIAGSVNVSRIDFEYVATADSNRAMTINGSYVSTFTDFNVLRIKSDYAGPFIQIDGGANVFFQRCKFRNLDTTGSLVPVLIRAENSGTVIDIKYSIFEYAGQLLSRSGTVFNISNSIFINPHPKYAFGSRVVQLDSSGSSLYSRNNAYLGTVAASTVAGSTAVSSNDAFHPDADGSPTGFDTGNIATATDSKRNINPGFLSRPNDLGELFIVIDDKDNTDEAYNFARDYASPNGIKISLAVNVHGDLNQPTGTMIDQWRWLVKNGHGIAAHGSTHSSFANLNGINISATGTSPTLSISGARSGDSSTWTGTLTVTINGTPLAVDLTNPSYDTIGELVAYLNGRSLGNGVITCAKANSTTNIWLKSLVLDDVANQSISSSYSAFLNENAFIRFEAVENILDIESYIKTGLDRNGLHAVTVSESAPAFFNVHEYRTANGDPRLALRNELLNDPGNLHDIWGGVQIYGERDTYDLGVQANPTNGYFGIYNFEYSQTSGNDFTIGAVMHAYFAPRLQFLLFHTTPTFNGSQQALVDLIKNYNLSTRLPEDYFYQIRNSGNWSSVGNGNYVYLGGDGAIYGQDYRINTDSPMFEQGVSIGPATDFAGNPIYGTPDIGAYEYQPPHTVGTDGVDISAGARIYGDGKFRHLSAASGSVADLAITPESGSFDSYAPTEARPQWMDITNLTWNISGDYSKQWTESSTMGNINTLHTIGDLEPNKNYNVAVDSVIGQNIQGANGTTCASGVCKADSNGKISFLYTGGYSTHTFEITEGDNTAPALSFTDDISAGPVQSDAITPNWGDASIKKWEYDTDNTCSTNANDYAKTDADSMDQNTETNNGKYVCLYGEDSAGNKVTLASANDINVDITSPNTSITINPDATVTSTSATFQFSATESSTFQCKLDAGSFTTCASPKTYTGLSMGAHTFEVKAIDQAGNADQTPAMYTWTIEASQQPESEPENPASVQQVSLPNPKLYLSGRRKSLSTTLRSDRITLKQTTPEIANGKVVVKNGSKTIAEIPVSQEGKWEGKIKAKKFVLEYQNSKGQTVSVSKEYKLKVDSEKPRIKTLYPLYVKHRGSKVTFRATDNEKIDYYRITVAGKTFKTEKAEFVIPSYAQKGSQRFTITAYDKAGNKSSKKGNLVVSW